MDLNLLLCFQFLVESLHSRHSSALQSTPDQGSESANQRELALDILAQIAHAFDFPDLHRFLTVSPVKQATAATDSEDNRFACTCGPILRLYYVEYLSRMFCGRLPFLAHFCWSSGPFRCCCPTWQPRRAPQAPPSSVLWPLNWRQTEERFSSTTSSIFSAIWSAPALKRSWSELFTTFRYLITLLVAAVFKFGGNFYRDCHRRRYFLKPKRTCTSHSCSSVAKHRLPWMLLLMSRHKAQ